MIIVLIMDKDKLYQVNEDNYEYSSNCGTSKRSNC